MAVTTATKAEISRTAFLADDDETSRTVLRSLLTAAGWQVVGDAADGKQALNEIRRLKPTVVCLDIEMPELSGLDVLTRVRPGNEHMIVLIVTAMPTAQNVRQAIQARADGVIAKPFNKDKIADELSRAVARKLLRR